MRKTFVFILIMLLLFSSGCAGERVAEPVGETRILLDTVCNLSIYGVPDDSLVEDAFLLCAEYEALFSISAEGSDIWQINHAKGGSVKTDPQTAAVVSAGLEYGRFSGGMFDITIGRLSTLWNFKGNASVPTNTELDEARSTVDFRQVIVEGDTVRLTNPDTWLDLGGIAKGFIADKLAEYVMERGAAGAVIDLGGDVIVAGEKPDGSPWRLGVRKPFGAQNELLGVVETEGASVVTSGIYERQFEEDGVLYHHILDPTTGMPVRSDVVSVTVVAENTMIGDALSTIILLVGSKRAAELAVQAPEFIGALLVLDSGEIMELGDISFEAF